MVMSNKTTVVGYYSEGWIVVSSTLYLFKYSLCHGSPGQSPTSFIDPPGPYPISNGCLTFQTIPRSVGSMNRLD